MAIHLEPIEIAAIGSSGAAVLLSVLALTVHLIRRSRRRRRRAGAEAQAQVRWPFTPSGREGAEMHRTSYTTFGHAPSPSGMGGYAKGSHSGSNRDRDRERAHTPVAPSPSTGHTVLITPTSNVGSSISRSKLKKLGMGGAAGRQGGRESPVIVRPDEHGSLGSLDGQGGVAAGIGRPESEMVVVTYEDGLRKLGIDPSQRPHHILYPEYDDEDERNLAHPVYTGGGAVVVGGRGDMEAVDSPRAVQGRRGSPRVPGQSGMGEGEGGAVESAWLPSYYHSPSAGRRAFEDAHTAERERHAGDTKLGYRRDTDAERASREKRWDRIYR